MWSVDVSEEDGKYLVLYIVKDTSRVCKYSPAVNNIFSDHKANVQKNLVWIANLDENEIGPSMKWYKLCNEFDAEYDMYVVPLLNSLPNQIHIIVSEYPMTEQNGTSGQTIQPPSTSSSPLTWPTKNGNSWTL